MDFFKRALPVLGMLALTSCATEWVQPGVSPATRDRELASCKANGYRAIPPDTVVTVHEGLYVRGEKKCKKRDGHKVCTREDDTWVPPSTTKTDRNEDARDAMIDNCMYRSGYSKE